MNNAATNLLDRSRLLLLTAALVGNAMAHALFLVTFPGLARQMGMTDLQAGLVISVSALLLTVSAPAWGWIAERWGRRPVLLIAVLGSALGAGLAVPVLQFGLVTTASGFGLMLSLRILYALLTGGMKPVAQAIMADTSSDSSRSRAMGWMGAAFGVGTLLGSGLVVATGQGQLLPAFALLGLALLVLTFWLWRALPESAPTAGGEAPLPVSQWLRFWPFLCITFLGLTLYSLLQQVTVWRLQDDFGLAPGQSMQMGGALLMLATAAMILGQGVIVRGLSWRPVTLIRIGSLLGLGAMVMAALAPALPWLVAGMVVLGLAVGLLLPGNLSALSLRAGPSRQARLAGVNGLFLGLGTAAGPMLGAQAQQWGPGTPYWLAALCFALIGLVAWLALRRADFPPQQRGMRLKMEAPEAGAVQ